MDAGSQRMAAWRRMAPSVMTPMRATPAPRAMSMTAMTSPYGSVGAPFTNSVLSRRVL